MTGQRVCVRTHEVGSVPIKFSSSYTLDSVARRFHHDCSSGFIDVKTTGEGFATLPLGTALPQLRDEDDIEGNGSWDNPFIVQVERAGAAGSSGQAGAGAVAAAGAASGLQLGAGAAAGGTSSLSEHFELLQVTAPVEEVFVARFIITAGMYHTQLMYISALEHGLSGTFYVQSLNCIKVTLVSAHEDYLKSFVEREVVRAPPGAELKKADIEPAVVMVHRSSDASHVAALKQLAGMVWLRGTVQMEFFKAVKQDMPSGLGHSSDMEASGSVRSLRSRSGRSEEEEEE